MISNTTENFELDELQLGCFPEGQVFREGIVFPEYYNTSTVTGKFCSHTFNGVNDNNFYITCLSIKVLGDDLRIISLSFTMGMNRKCSQYQDPGIDLSTITMCTPSKCAFSPCLLNTVV